MAASKQILKIGISMHKTSLLNQILRLLLPGRRRLLIAQLERESIEKDQNSLLINEFVDLARLKSTDGKVTNLATFNDLEFRAFLNEKRSADSWKEAENRASSFHLPEMIGGVNKGDQRLLFHLIEYLKPVTCLEIGTHVGYSTIHILLGLLAEGIKSPTLTTVDIRDVNCEREKPWIKAGTKHSPKELVRSLTDKSIVQFQISSSTDYLKHTSANFDFIFLDGDHSAKTVYQEIPLALSRLSPKGIILLHDYFPDLKPLWANAPNASSRERRSFLPGVYLAVQRLINEGLELSVFPMGELPWETKFGGRTTSLAVLARQEKQA